MPCRAASTLLVQSMITSASSPSTTVRSPMSLFRTWYSRSITWYRPDRRMTWD